MGQKWWTPYAFMAPGIVLFGAMFLWPAVIAVELSFARYNIVSPLRWVGLANFERLGEDGLFVTALVNSLKLLLMMLPLTVVVPLFLAMLVDQKLRGIQVFRVLYYLPVVTSMVAVAIAWRYLLTRDGLLSWMGTMFGAEPMSFLLSPEWALPSIAFIESWKNMGLYMILYLAGLQGISTDLLEAARMDGANAWQRLAHVIIPGLLPFAAITLTMSMLEGMRSFESVFMLTRGGPNDATITLGYYVWHLAFEKYDMGYASAVGLVMLVLMIVLSLLNQFATRERA